MIDRAHAVEDRRRLLRPLLFIAIVVAHLVAIWLLLRPSPVTVDETASALAVFNVALPPSLPVPVPVPPPPPPPPPPQSATRMDDAPKSGGSPGTRRERPAARIEVPAPPMREAMDATIAPLAPPTIPALPAGTAIADFGAGGAGGKGNGTGTGSGPGDGDGGSGDRMARAEWILVPSSATYGRYWPIGQSKLASTVTVRLSCSVRRNGQPYRCRILSETPPRLGFGATALAVLPVARIRPVAHNGAPLWGVPVLITLNFDAIETAPRLPISAAASAPRAR